jgi:Holliday junction resolvase
VTLQRRTPLRAQPRSKGNRAEREVIDLLRAMGWTSARRNLQSGGQGGGDVVEGPIDVHVEIKHREACRIWQWIEQAESEARPTDMPLVAFRRNRSRWYAAVPLDELLELVKLREKSMENT